MLKTFLIVKKYPLFSNLLIPIVKSRKNTLIILFTLMTALSFSTILIPRILGDLAIVLNKKPFQVLTKELLLIVLIFIVRFIFQFLVTYYSQSINSYFILKTKQALVKVLIISSFEKTIKFNQADLMERTWREIGIIVGKSSIGFLFLIKDLLSVIFIMLAIFYISPIVCLLIICVGSLFYLLSKFIFSKTVSLSSKIQLLNVKFLKDLIQVIHGKRDIQDFGLSYQVFSDISNNTNESIRLNSSLSKYKGLIDSIVELILPIFLLGMLLILFLFESTFSVIILVSYILFIIVPIREMSKYLNSLGEVKPSLIRCEKLLQELMITSNNQIILKDSKSSIGIGNPSLVIKNLHYSYGRSSVITNLNYTFSKGFYQIIGSNGSGKSTLADLLTGHLTPVSGVIYLNDSLDFKSENLRQFVKVARQSPFLINGKVSKNIFFDEKSISSIENFPSFIKSQIKNMINIDLVDNGNNISGGQKQIISITRAILSNPEILILDELSNNLPENEFENILHFISNFRKEKITIYLTHDYSKNVPGFLLELKSLQS